MWFDVFFMFIRFLLKIGVSFIISVVILSIIILPVNYQGIHVENETGATDYKWRSYQIKTTMKEGFAWLQMDKYGFNTQYEDDRNVDYLLMGSSHMQAYNVGKTENVAYLLSQHLNCKIYNIGQSGHTLPRIVNNLKNAYEYYRPRQGIIIETDRVVFDKRNLDDVVCEKLDKLPSYNKGVVFWIQELLPASSLIFKQIIQWIKVSNITSKKEIIKNKTNDNNAYKESLSAFIKKARKSIPINTQLILFYHPKSELDATGRLVYDKISIENKIELNEICNKEGIKFIDTSDDLNSLYKNEFKLTHGFINTKIGVGHLNKFGHKVIAEHLAKILVNFYKELPNNVSE